ncbi:Glycosyltransferase family 2 protein [Pararobbsia alpina]|uniref:glycosyltransferase family 2 protein n=1 Tax=Pararobbsia alpina TaxID=621374 RepID=UPI0039A622DE
MTDTRAEHREPSEPLQPLVTAIIPTYRRATMVRQAVETVLSQDYASIEVIVVDDNTDVAEQQAVRAALADFGEQVVVIPNQRQKGACGARNTGIERARGDYIAFLDDDDLWLPGKIREQVSLLERTAYVASFCGYIDVDMAFNHARRCRSSRPVLKREHALAGECPTSTSLVLIRKSVLVDAGLFDESLPSFQDFDMWLRCLEKGDFGYVDEALVTFVQHEGERTSVNLTRRLAGLAAIEAKWGHAMSAQVDFAAFKRRVIVDALIANGKARMGAQYVASLGFFTRAMLADRLSKRTVFWFAIGALGSTGGKALYTRLLGMRHVETVPVAA